MVAQPLSPTQPTIWALRRNVRSVQDNQPSETPAVSGSLYEHLFGYDPIRVLGLHKDMPVHTDAAVTAENPKLNIINAQTNFALMEIAADLPPEKP